MRLAYRCASRSAFSIGSSGRLASAIRSGKPVRNGIIGNVSDALARSFVDFRGLHVLLRADPFGRDVHKAGVHKERIYKLLLHVALRTEFREVRDRDLDAMRLF